MTDRMRGPVENLTELRVEIDCVYGDNHLPTVTVSRRPRDRFRRRYWVRCWACPMRLGPFYSALEADNCRQDVDRRGSVKVALGLEGIETHG